MIAKAEEKPNISDTTGYRIRELDRAVEHVKASPTPGHVRARKKKVYQLGVELKNQSDRLVSNLERGEAWFTKNADHPKYAEREEQWLQWLTDYEAIEDALERAQEIDG